MSRRIWKPIIGCRLISSHSSSVNDSGLRRIASGIPILPTSWSKAPSLRSVRSAGERSISAASRCAYSATRIEWLCVSCSRASSAETSRSTSPSTSSRTGTVGQLGSGFDIGSCHYGNRVQSQEPRCLQVLYPRKPHSRAREPFRSFVGKVLPLDDADREENAVADNEEDGGQGHRAAGEQRV